MGGTYATNENSRSWTTAQHNLPVLAFGVTPSLSVSGTHPPARLQGQNQLLLPQCLTTQSTNTLAMALLLVTSAVAVVPVITVPESASVSRVSQVPPVRKLLISSKF